MAATTQLLRKTRSSVIKRYDPSLPHTYNLPFEIIAEIFLQYIDLGGYVYDVAGVCRGWREIALSTPALWSQISLFPNERPRSQWWQPFDSEWNLDMYVERLRTIISRAKFTPLDVDISIYPRYDGQLSQISVDLFPILLETGTKRWRSLKIGLISYYRGQIRLLELPEPLDFSNLLTLRISLPRGWDPSDSSNPFLLLFTRIVQTGSKIENFEYESGYGVIPNFSPLLPKITYCSLDDAFCLAKHKFLNLTSLLLAGDSYYRITSDRMDSAKLYFPVLARLELHYVEAIIFLQRIDDTSSIKYLRVFGHMEMAGEPVYFNSLERLDWDCSHLAALHSMHAPNLRSLSIPDISFTELTTDPNSSQPDFYSGWSEANHPTEIALSWKAPLSGILAFLGRVPYTESIYIRLESGDMIRKQKMINAFSAIVKTDSGPQWRLCPGASAITFEAAWPHSRKDSVKGVLRSIATARQGSRLEKIDCVWSDGVREEFVVQNHLRTLPTWQVL